MFVKGSLTVFWFPLSLLCFQIITTFPLYCLFHYSLFLFVTFSIILKKILSLLPWVCWDLFLSMCIILPPFSMLHQCIIFFTILQNWPSTIFFVWSLNGILLLLVMLNSFTLSRSFLFIVIFLCGSLFLSTPNLLLTSSNILQIYIQPLPSQMSIEIPIWLFCSTCPPMMPWHLLHMHSLQFLCFSMALYICNDFSSIIMLKRKMMKSFVNLLPFLFETCQSIFILFFHDFFTYHIHLKSI